MAHVADNADDRNPIRVLGHSSHYDPFSDRFLNRPEFFGKSLIHDDDRRRVCVIGISEESAFDQWYLERAKIIWRNLAVFFVGARVTIVRWLAFDGKG